MFEYTISIAYDWFCFGYSWRLFDSHWRSAYFLHFIKKTKTNSINRSLSNSIDLNFKKLLMRHWISMPIFFPVNAIIFIVIEQTKKTAWLQMKLIVHQFWAVFSVCIFVVGAFQMTTNRAENVCFVIMITIARQNTPFYSCLLLIP